MTTRLFLTTFTLGLASLTACSKGGSSSPAPASPAPSQSAPGAVPTPSPTPLVMHPLILGSAATPTPLATVPRPVVGGATSPAATVVPQIYQLGAFFMFQLTPDLHMTEYSFNTNATSQLAYYRVTPQTDPSYLGNYACDGKFDSPLAPATAPDGVAYDYCLTTPPNSEVLSFLTTSTLTNNHLEVATTPTAPQRQQLDFNVFDADYPYKVGRSRFEHLCADHQGAIYVATSVVFMKQMMPGKSIRANMYICTADLAEPTGDGLPQRNPSLWQNTWWIGAFFLTPPDLDLPDVGCVTGQTVGPLDVVATIALLTTLDSTDAFGGVSAPVLATTPPTTCAAFINPNMLEVDFATNTPYPDPSAFGAAFEGRTRGFLRLSQPAVVN